MLIGVRLATRKIAASATTTAAPPTTSGTRRGDDRAEDEQQRDRGQRQRDDLAPAEVGLRDRLDVAVERRAAGQLDLEPGRLAEPLADPGQGRRRIVRARSTGRRCRRRCGRRSRPGAGSGCGARSGRRTARRGRAAIAVGRRRLERGRAGGRAVAVVGRRRPPTAGSPAPSWRSAFARADSRSSRMKPPARSTPDDARRERDRGEQDDRPDGDDRPAPPNGEPAEAGANEIRRGRRSDGRVNGRPALRHAVHGPEHPFTSVWGGRHARPMLYRRSDQRAGGGWSGPYGETTIDATERDRRAGAADPRQPRGLGAATMAWAQDLADRIGDEQPTQHVAVFVPDERPTACGSPPRSGAPARTPARSSSATGSSRSTGSVCGRVFRTGLAALCADVTMDPDYRPSPAAGRAPR